MKRILKKKKKK